MTRNRGLKKLASNENLSGFTAKTVLATAEPSGNKVMKLADEFGGLVPSAARLIFFGIGSDNDVFSARVWGWTRFGTTASQSMWVPTMLLEVSATLSTFVGVAGYPILNTQRFADTITVVATVGEPTTSAATTPNGTVILYSPANNTPAWVQTPLYGSDLIEFDFDQTTGTPTENVFVQFLDETDGS